MERRNQTNEHDIRTPESTEGLPVPERIKGTPAPEPEEEDWVQDEEALPLIDRDTFYDLLMEQQEQM